MSEPRQFWIYDIGEEDCTKAVPFMQRGFVPLDKDIRVIEYSAYAELQEKLKVAEEALEELANLMDDVVTGEYTPDSFTTKTSREALAKIRGEG